MAKKAYAGVSDVARKVSKMYIGVGGVARKVKKAYVGVNGVARLFFQLFQYTGLAYHSGSIATLTHAVYENGAASIGNIVIFAGGLNRSRSISSSQAISINTSNTKTVLTGLSSGRGYCYGASNDNYAIFNRGINHNWVDIKYIDYYSKLGTRSSISTSNYFTTTNQAGEITRAEDNVYIFTPINGSTNVQLGKLSSNMTLSNISTLTQNTDVGWTLKGTLKGRAVFQNLNKAWRITDSGVITSLENTLYHHQQGYSGNVNDKYIMFCGGYDNSTSTNVFTTTADYYNASTFTKGILQETYARQNPVNCSIDRFYLASSGYANGSYVNYSCYYDEDLVEHTISSGNIRQSASAALGDKIYHGGGLNSTGTYQNGINYFYLTQ